MATLNPERRERLQTLAQQSKDARAATEVASRKLQDEVVAAVDEDKAAVPEVARALGLSKTRVYDMIAQSYRR